MRWDIGIIPLAANAFNANKSYLKFLEYGAMGMAIICSNGPEYRRVVRHGETGLLVDNKESAWLDALQRVVRSADERQRLAMNALVDVKTAHTLTTTSKQLLQLLRTSNLDRLN